MASEVATLVDSNVLLDILTMDETWDAWSTAALADALDSGPSDHQPHRVRRGVRGLLSALRTSMLPFRHPNSSGSRCPSRQASSLAKPSWRIGEVVDRNQRRCPTSTSAPTRRWPAIAF